MNCKICESNTNKLYETIVLKKYNVSYFKCSKCNFIQTEEPFWLPEAYSSAITSLDIGLISRNLFSSSVVETTIKLLFKKEDKFLDYGGGYGMFVRMMRDRGFDFYRQDVFCENLFAKNFDITDLPDKDTKFELLTAFEVFEHLVNPMEELKKMLRLSDNILFSTYTHDKNVDLNNWWYMIPETGQHISLYSSETIKFIADHFGLNYYSKYNFHLLTKKNIPVHKSYLVFNKLFRKIYNPITMMQSLLESDFNKLSSNTLSNK